MSASAFSWLVSRAGPERDALVRLESPTSVRLDNYVGVFETPCGTQIEVLPKHHDHADDVPASRRLLIKMLVAFLDLPSRQADTASVSAFTLPLQEWVARQFLCELDRLVKIGVTFEYENVEEEQRFLRGRLNLGKQAVQRPGRGHFFQIEHDLFSPNRAENRLLRTALSEVRRVTGDPQNWRLAHELLAYLAILPSSSDIRGDFRNWRSDRLTAHYQAVRPWCQLILTGNIPMAVSGAWRGLSLLFPMERLFERYVAVSMQADLAPGARLITQAARKHLCEHRGQKWFQLRPDLMITSGETTWIADTKWKRLDVGQADRKYGLNQGDFYQLFAYGQRYLGAAGDMLLIYPLTEMFSHPLPTFFFSQELRLFVVPFDLQMQRLHLPAALKLPFRKGSLTT